MILNDFFDKIFVINLKDSVDRKNHIINEFNKNNITNYEFFEAVHFDDPSVSSLLNSNQVMSFPPCFRCLKDRCGCENNFLTKFQIANWCSYIKLFNQILESEHDLVLICEDDIVFSKNSQYICNSLLNQKTFNKYKINLKLPLMIKMGSAYDVQTHNLYKDPQYIKNYSLSNPCFALNKEMIKIFLYNLKMIDYHSDVYFHKQIPQKFPNLQILVMNPFPVYELSFVKSIQKFNSLVRPKNQVRRKEYKDFLFITIHKFLEYIPNKYAQILKLNISNKNIGFNGTINHYFLLNEHNKERFHFQNKIFIYDNETDDIQIMVNDLNYKSQSYLSNIILLVIDKYQLEIDKDISSIVNNIKIIYNKMLDYFKEMNFLMININEQNIFSKYNFINQYKNIKQNFVHNNV
jgi:GR25 family glycosyltransferase involved in LPS biosynthesis|tara:strand:+ start:5561 stop:6778 length:1218 start_codon:yes stop_codon:yes gene_type:complete